MPRHYRLFEDALALVRVCSLYMQDDLDDYEEEKLARERLIEECDKLVRQARPAQNRKDEER
jgi:hypothetical protein